jgi:hypothetical protein
VINYDPVKAAVALAKVLAMAFLKVVIDPIRNTAINASNMAYSAAARPSSSFTKWRMAFNMAIISFCTLINNVLKPFSHHLRFDARSVTGFTNPKFCHLLHLVIAPDCRIRIAHTTLQTGGQVSPTTN